MGFINSYKHLEKLCGEVFGDDRRISAYIDKMQKISDGSYCVSTWNEDLKRLKHYRWLRNQISHEPNCTEENMCSPKDELWLNDFYSRIITQRDPLTLYQKAHCSNKSTIHTQNIHKQDRKSAPRSNRKKSQDNPTGYAAFVIIFMLVILGVILFYTICR